MDSQKESIPSPHQTAEEIIKRLQNLADSQIARQGQRFFKDKVRLLGIPAPKLRQEARLVYNKIKPYWTLEDTLEFCRLLLLQPEVEIRSLAVLVLSRYKADLENKHLGLIKNWLKANYFDNWALVDLLSPTIISPLIEKHPEIINKLFAWTKDPNLWVRRVALVSLVPLVRQGKFLSEAYKMVNSLLSDKEDLIHKAMGWLLREAGKKDANRLEKFLLAHGPQIPRTTVHYALERFPKEKRKKLLHATRSLKVESKA